MYILKYYNLDIFIENQALKHPSIYTIIFSRFWYVFESITQLSLW